MFENRELRGTFRPKKDEITGEWRRLHNEELHDLYSSPNISRVMKWRRTRRTGQDMWHVWGTGEINSGFWWGDLREKDHFKDMGVDRMSILKYICKWWDGKARTGLIWLRAGTVDRRLWMRWWTFGFHIIQGIYWLVEYLVLSQKGPCCMELVNTQGLIFPNVFATKQR